MIFITVCCFHFRKMHGSEGCGLVTGCRFFRCGAFSFGPWDFE